MNYNYESALLGLLERIIDALEGIEANLGDVSNNISTKNAPESASADKDI